MQDWLSYHVYYHSSQHLLLLHGVRPLVEELEQAGLIDRFFFLRYWNGGPHLRLRFRLTAANSTVAAALIEERLRASLKQHPSSVPLTPAMYESMAVHLGRAEPSEPEPLAPNNSIAAIRYDPELDKYGGRLGVAFAEDVFDASSRAVLATLTVELGKRELMGAALLAMLVGVSALGYGNEAAHRFFERYSQFWQGHVDAITGTLPLPPARANAGVTQIARAIMEERRQPARLEKWRALLESARTRLGLRPGSEADEARLAFFATNYFHTHNNRLGLLTVDESYLGKLGAANLALMSGAGR